MFFIKFGKFLVIISSNVLFALFLSLLLLAFPQCMCWSAWWGPTGFLDSGDLIYFFFLFFRPDHFSSSILRFADFISACPNQMLNPSRKFVLFFNRRISGCLNQVPLTCVNEISLCWQGHHINFPLPSTPWQPPSGSLGWSVATHV